MADGALGAVTNGEAHWSAPYTGPGLDASYHAGQYAFVAEAAIATFGAALGLSPCSEEAAEALNELPPTEVNPSTPVGRSGLKGELNVTSPNDPATINGRDFSGHALDRMQGRGLTPSVVEDAIANGESIPSRGGTTIHYSPENNISVVTNADGKVVIVSSGRFKR